MIKFWLPQPSCVWPKAKLQSKKPQPELLGTFKLLKLLKAECILTGFRASLTPEY